MASPTQTDRQYAYFRAEGTDEPSWVSSRLDLTPDRCWCLGEPYERNGKVFTRRSSVWALDSGLDDTQPLNDHIETLLKRLEPHRNAVLGTGTRFRTQIVCVAYCFESFNWELSFHAQRLATALGISFVIDSYSLGDYHEEIVALREELGLRSES